MTQKAITVYVVRHGERQDKALKKQFRNTKAWKHNSERKRQLQEQDEFDPMLTETGHMQAHEAFQTLSPALKGKKVAVFASPMRRAIGTALMIGSVDCSKTKFAPEIHGGDSIVPVTILNGLGDYASAVSATGGVDYLLSRHADTYNQMLPCSDHARNYAANLETPLAKTCATMPISNGARINKSDKKNPSSVQFIGYNKSHNSFHWLSPPIQKESRNYDEKKSHIAYPPGFQQDPISWQPRPFDAFNHAVELTQAMGAQVCVIVAHREAIYEMSYDTCCYQGHLLVPYCGIGIYTATTATYPRHNTSVLDYTFHGVATGNEHLALAKSLNIPRSYLVDDSCPVTTLLLWRKGKYRTLGKIASCTRKMKGQLGTTMRFWWTRAAHFEVLRRAPFVMVEGRSDILRLLENLKRKELKRHCLVGECTWVFPGGSEQTISVKFLPQPEILPSPAPLIVDIVRFVR